MSEITRKIAAVVLTFALAFTVVGPVVLAEDDVEDLQQQIADLQAAIVQLQAKAAGTTPTTPATDLPAACAAISSFARNLSLGSRGADVKCLQAMLNKNDHTQVAASGVGSAGQETEYFGPLTRSAVVNFQTRYAAEVLTPIGLTAGTGFVGTRTRAKLNAMLTVAPVTPPVTPPVDDEDEEDVDEEYTGVEGELEAKVLPTPTSNQDLNWGSSNVAVMNIELKAKDSPMRVSRVDLNFSDASPWNFVNYVTLYDGDNALQGRAMTRDNTVATAGGRRMRISGLNVVVPADGTKTLSVRVSTDSRPRTISPTTITVSVDDNDVRATDGAGLTQYNVNTNTISRTFYNAATAEGARVEVKLNSNNPAERIVQTDLDLSTEHELLRFDLKATKDSAEITKLTFTPAGDATSTQINAFKLYEVGNDDAIGAVSASSSATADFSFENLSIEIAKDATKSFSVRAEAAKAADGRYVKASYTNTSMEGISGNGEDVTDTGSANGHYAHFYMAAPAISGVLVDVVDTKHSTTGLTTIADVTIAFNLTAQGGDIVLSSTTATTAPNVQGAAMIQVAGATSTLTVIQSTLAGTTMSGATDEDLTIADGETKQVVVKGRVSGGDNTVTAVSIEQITWTGGSITGRLLDALKTAAFIMN